MNIQNQQLKYVDVNKIVTSILDDTQHSKRIQSIVNATLGIISSASLIVHRIGRGMAEALNLSDKHAIKQVDRLLSNEKFDIEASEKNWIMYVIGGRKEVKIAMDWTDFDGDNHTTLSLSLVTSHGRATPLLSKTVSKSTLKNNRNDYEDALLVRLRHAIAAELKVTILADRGFCDIKLFDFLKNTLHFNYIIRIRGNVLVENMSGEMQNAVEYVKESGQTRTLRNVKITSKGYQIETFVAVKAKKMKQAWCIASSQKDISGSGIVKWYSKRWGCEPTFRDIKDIFFGMGLSHTQIKDAKKRDRLLFVHAIATIILTFLGAAGEKIGLDKYLKANTSKKRSLSLLHQGIIYFNRLPRMVEGTLKELINCFCDLVTANKTLVEILGVI